MALPEFTQRVIIKIILISNFTEYAIIILELFTIAKSQISHCRATKDLQYKTFLEENYGVIVYAKEATSSVKEGAIIPPTIMTENQNVDNRIKFRRRLSQEG